MTRQMTYCVVPVDTDPDVVAALRLEYAGDPWTSVILDDRAGEEHPGSETLKQRRPVLRWDLPGDSIAGARFEQHMPPVDLSLADLPDREIIARAILHDTAASTELRWRSYARVLVLLTERLASRNLAHEMVPAVMDSMQRALPTIPKHMEFSRWLSTFIAEMPLER